MYCIHMIFNIIILNFALVESMREYRTVSESGIL